MCGSMVDIQSVTTEIRREKKSETTGQKYDVRTCYSGRPCIHRASTASRGKSSESRKVNCAAAAVAVSPAHGGICTPREGKLTNAADMSNYVR